MNIPNDLATEYVQAQPIFGKPLPYRDIWPEVFVMTPFGDPFDAIYTDHIRKIVNAINVECKRADDFFSVGPILRDIWNAIYHSKVCIADCTGRNPNVFYELGMAHTLGRPVILTTQDKDDIPFDIHHIRVIPYKYDPRGMQTYEKKLEKTLRSELEPYLQQLQDDKPLKQALSILLDKYPRKETQITYARNVEAFMTWRDSCLPASLSEQVARYMEYLESECNAAPRTILLHFSIIKQLIKVAARNNGRFAGELLRLDDIKLPEDKPPDVEHTYLSTEQAQQLLDAPGTDTPKGLRDTSIIGLLMIAHLRRTEIADLRWGQIDKERGQLVVFASPGKRMSSKMPIDLPPWLIETIVGWGEAVRLTMHLPESPVFYAMEKGEKLSRDRRRLTSNSVYNVVAYYARMIGLPTITPDDLRLRADYQVSTQP